MKQDILRQIEGYDRILRERAVCRRYGQDFLRGRAPVQRILEGLHPPRLRLRVAGVWPESPSAKTFRLVSLDGPLPPFQAGQYLAVACEIGLVRTSRPYSISSPPHVTGYWDITVKAVEGGFVSTHLLERVQPGQVLEATGPAGTFVWNPLLHGRDLVLIAGGSGITPCMAFVRETIDCGGDRRLFLFYGNREETDVIFGEELARLAERFPATLRYIPVIEKPGAAYRGACGFITGELIRQEAGDLADKTFFLCGPAEMYAFCIPELLALGIRRRRIRREMSGPSRAVSRQPGWPPDVSPEAVFSVWAGDREAFPARAGEPLLVSLERQGVTAVPSRCRSGECSLCRVRLVSGRVYQPEGVLLRTSDRRHGFIHACAAYPLSDLEIRF